MHEHQRLAMYGILAVVFGAVAFALSVSSFTPTGLAVADQPAECAGYYGDAICDDTQSDCGPSYHPTASVPSCNECQTGGFAC